MTYPPQGSEDAGADGAGTAPRVGPGFPAPTPPPAYGQSPPYDATPQPYGQAPHGQAPQYGPPADGPPWYGVPGQQAGPPAGPGPKSKVGTIAVLTLVALVVIVAAVVLVRTFQSTVLDAASAERDVAAQFQEREGVAVDLDCPDDMEVRARATYACTGKTADGESVTLRLAITDARKAAYTWTEP